MCMCMCVCVFVCVCVIRTTGSLHSPICPTLSMQKKSHYTRKIAVVIKYLPFFFWRTTKLKTILLLLFTFILCNLYLEHIKMCICMQCYLQL
jgi:hypothetical protein